MKASATPSPALESAPCSRSPLRSLLNGLLVAVSSRDPATLAVVAALLIAVAAAAAFLPARRAARVDLVIAERAE